MQKFRWVFTLFLVIGVCLFVSYHDKGLQAPAETDRIYPDFIWNHLPIGISGLVIAAILAAAFPIRLRAWGRFYELQPA